MRLVLDTNVVVSGLIWGGVPRQLLDLGRDGHTTLFTSSLLLDELADVLGRSKFAAMLASQQTTPESLMRRYGILAKLVDPVNIKRTVAHDADDDAVIATALGAQADLIVTGDSHLLKLHLWRGIQILKPNDALQFVLNADAQGG